MAQSSRTVTQATYHPGGTGTSPSLRRARQPFRLGNAAIGFSLLAFTLGVYTYSIAAVKQDDFSDVEDLLPPMAERSGLRSIEDEERELLATTTGRDVPQTSSPSALSPGLPPTTHATGGSSGWYWPRRLDQVGWIRNAGLVEPGTGNVLVWGAPNVDNIGSMRERSTGSRLV